MKCRLTVPHDRLPVGHEIEHEEAHLLVEMGLAEPADDQCRQAAVAAEERTKMSQANSAAKRKQRISERRARTEAMLKARQQEFAHQLGVETTDDARAASAEKRGQA